MLTIHIDNLNGITQTLKKVPDTLGNYCLMLKEEPHVNTSIIQILNTIELEEIFNNMFTKKHFEQILHSIKKDFEEESGKIAIPWGHVCKGNICKNVKIQVPLGTTGVLVIINISHIVYSIVERKNICYGTISIIEEKCMCEKDKELRIPITGNPVSDADIYKVFDEDGVWRGEVQIECYDYKGDVIYYQDKINYCPICGRLLD